MGKYVQKIRGRQYPVQKVEDKKILILMSSEMYMGNPYTVVFYNDITEIYERTARLFAKGLMMTLVLLLLAGGILYRSLSYTIRPLLQLKDAAAAISEGNYQVRVDDSRKDEIGQLAKSFNHMAMTVQENIEALTSTNETQRRMLGSLAHELKTPMTAIIGYADYASDSPFKRQKKGTGPDLYRTRMSETVQASVKNAGADRSL